MKAISPKQYTRFQPQFLTEEDLEDLFMFTGLDKEACLARVQNYSMNELAEAWNEAGPQSPEDIRAFYSSTDLYVWELMQWHSSPNRQPYWASLSWFVENFKPEKGWGRVIDFGCGIGTDALFLAGKGYQVTCMDIPGRTFEFAKSRFARRGLAATFIESRASSPFPSGPYDAALCFDVFEHLPDPFADARLLVESLRNGGLLLQTAHFDDDDGIHPCHLPEGRSKYSGLRWHINLAALGLRCAGPLAYRKSGGLIAAVQRLRYLTWRGSSLWLIKVSR